jgi:DNA-binding MarR family transcriptional regulator
MEDLHIECHKKLMELSWRVIKRARSNLLDLGFAWNQYSIIKALKPGETLTLSDICQRVNRKNSNVTPIIDFLVSQGMVERIPDSSDRRVIRVGLTEDGILKREQAITSHENFIRELYKDLEKGEMKDFLDVMEVFLEKTK